MIRHPSGASIFHPLPRYGKSHYGHGGREALGIFQPHHMATLVCCPFIPLDLPCQECFAQAFPAVDLTGSIPGDPRTPRGKRRKCNNFQLKDSCNSPDKEIWGLIGNTIMHSWLFKAHDPFFPQGAWRLSFTVIPSLRLPLSTKNQSSLHQLLERLLVDSETVEDCGESAVYAHLQDHLQDFLPLGP